MPLNTQIPVHINNMTTDQLEEQTFYLRMDLAIKIAEMQVQLLAIGADAYKWRHLKNLKKSQVAIDQLLNQLIPMLDRLEELTR